MLLSLQLLNFKIVNFSSSPKDSGKNYKGLLLISIVDNVFSFEMLSGSFINWFSWASRAVTEYMFPIYYGSAVNDWFFKFSTDSDRLLSDPFLSNSEKVSGDIVKFITFVFISSAIFFKGLFNISRLLMAVWASYAGIYSIKLFDKKRVVSDVNTAI